jgi:putative transposase
MELSSPIRKRIHHWNTPGHAHELTFSCYRRQDYFSDGKACELFMDEVGKAREFYSFRLWAYVIMPNHVHLLIWPVLEKYDISKILSGIKGVMAKQYRKYLLETSSANHGGFLTGTGETASFTFWQPGGGFDRNLWNAKAIHDSIKYIESNPVRKKKVGAPEEWQWSSAFGRTYGIGLVPDEFHAPVLMHNAQSQRIGIV